MAYVAVKGGERAIDNAHAWLHEERRGDPDTPALSVRQIENQLGRARLPVWLPRLELHARRRRTALQVEQHRRQVDARDAVHQ